MNEFVNLNKWHILFSLVYISGTMKRQRGNRGYRSRALEFEDKRARVFSIIVLIGLPNVMTQLEYDYWIILLIVSSTPIHQ